MVHPYLHALSETDRSKQKKKSERKVWVTSQWAAKRNRLFLHCMMTVGLAWKGSLFAQGEVRTAWLVCTRWLVVWCNWGHGGMGGLHCLLQALLLLSLSIRLLMQPWAMMSCSAAESGHTNLKILHKVDYNKGSNICRCVWNARLVTFNVNS